MSMPSKSKTSPPPPPPPTYRKGEVIRELRKGSQLAALLRQQVALMPDLDRRDTALANARDVSMALESSLSILQSEGEHCSSSENGAVAEAAPSACAAGGAVGRNGAVARTRKAKHWGRPGQELPIKETLTETPENDGFHWRKYGEKKILNAAFPRMYYRCGYSEDHKCPAKKYVQQRDDNPSLFNVTLINEHTCNTLFPDQPNTSTAISQVLDFTKASVLPPAMNPAVAALSLKNEEETITSSESTRFMSMTIPGYAYADELSSSLPLLTPNPWGLEMQPSLISSLFPQNSGSSSSN